MGEYTVEWSAFGTATIIDIEALSAHPNDWLILLVAGAFIMGALLLPWTMSISGELYDRGRENGALLAWAMFAIIGACLIGFIFLWAPHQVRNNTAAYNEVTDNAVIAIEEAVTDRYTVESIRPNGHTEFTGKDVLAIVNSDPGEAPLVRVTYNNSSKTSVWGLVYDLDSDRATLIHVPEHHESPDPQTLLKDDHNE